MDNNIDNFNFPSPPPSQLPPLQPIQEFCQPQPPSQPRQILMFKRKNDVVTKTTQTLSGDRLIGELERVIDKEKPKGNLVPEEEIIFTLPNSSTILDDEEKARKRKQ